MKKNSVLAKIDALIAPARNVALSKSTQKFKQQQQILNLDGTKKKSFLDNLSTQQKQFFDKQRQKYDQDNEAILKKAGWKGPVFSGTESKVYFNPTQNDVRLVIRTDGTFAIYKGGSFPLFKDDKPIAGPGNVSELETELSNFKLK